MSENNLRYLGKSKKDDFGRWFAYLWIDSGIAIVTWREIVCESREQARDIVKRWKAGERIPYERLNK